MAKLSVIMPFVREYPQNMFTIKNIAEELKDRADFEIVAVDNYCDQVHQQNYTCSHCGTNHPPGSFKNDKGGEAIKACERMHPWLKFVQYGDKLSHWNAKNYGVKKSSGDILWFCDSHCVIHRDALYEMYKYFRSEHEKLNGTLHLPLTYKILEAHRTIYKPVFKIDKGEYGYTLTGYKPADWPYEVAAMSTCGMMMTRKMFDELRAWPSEMGIYGGGEHYINFTMAVMGYKKWIYPGKNSCLVHHGEKRGYHYVYDDYIRNKILATYLFGGKAIAELFIQHAKGRPPVLRSMLDSVIANNSKRRDYIKSKSIIDITSWANGWLGI